MEKEFESSIFNSNQYVGGSNDIVEAKGKERQLFSYVSDSNLRRHIEIDLNKIPKEDEEDDHEAAIRRRLDLNKHPIDIGELNSNLEFEDVIVSMLKIYYPLFY
ncbi:hypothetical protein LIER_25893 [Lithospermum erythrorhizon]|uniref:Uncharacterized protein n=1 Tax=Lithospermum erythrorhizon TaxID=34254 RepID=A0AAV3R9J1_LITER